MTVTLTDMKTIIYPIFTCVLYIYVSAESEEDYLISDLSDESYNDEYETEIDEISVVSDEYKTEIEEYEEETYDDEDYSFLVSLHYKTESETKHICSGSILSETWILTAAHCVCYMYTSVIISPNDVYVISDLAMLQEVNISDSSTSTRAKNIYIYPDYNFEKLKNDLALIELNSSLNPSLVQPINLKPKDTWIHPYSHMRDTFQICTAIGWSDNEIHKINLYILRNDECQIKVNTDQICAILNSYDLDDDICQEESGGPLICDDYQVGVATYRLGCGAEGMESIFTKLDHYVPWIEEVTKNQLFSYKRQQIMLRRRPSRPGGGGGWRPPSRPGGGGWRPPSRPGGGGWRPPNKPSGGGWRPPNKPGGGGWRPPNKPGGGGWRPPNKPGGSGWRPPSRPGGRPPSRPVGRPPNRPGGGYGRPGRPNYNPYVYGGRPGGRYAYHGVRSYAYRGGYVRRYGGYSYYGVAYRPYGFHPIGIWYGRPILFYYRPWFFLDFYLLHAYYWHPMYHYHMCYGYGYRGSGHYTNYDEQPPPAYASSYCHCDESPTNTTEGTSKSPGESTEPPDPQEPPSDSENESTTGSTNGSTSGSTSGSTGTSTSGSTSKSKKRARRSTKATKETFMKEKCKNDAPQFYTEKSENLCRKQGVFCD